ncbi:uncharacterized protein (DUF885 family) [Povalibacter uvarum]|uniref:Uncharacterized protein (DUF885 family) n=1 Tax=Povalibacter uvarum TaxID=732238 RepID=A0A841HL34_9GAMM|nr:DUF885 domain-containing protein [Povalibacter uvarum]MBB6092832.1 uncharacterized protein (DUF885 family) [Povalibacter uvarum]
MRALRQSTFALVLAVAGLSLAQAAAPGASPELNKLFDDYFEKSLELSPLQATFIGDDRYDDKLTNSISPEFIRMALEVDRSYLDAALKYDPKKLSPEDRLSWEIFVHERRVSIESAKFPGELLPIDQMFSIPTLMPVLASATSAQPFKTVEDYDQFLARMNDYITWSDQAVVNMREGIRRNVVQPRVVMQNVQKQLAALIAEDPLKSIFYTPVTQFPDGFAAADRTRLEKAYRDAVVSKINPSYRRLHDFVRDEYLPKTRATVAWTALPDGPAWYAFLVKNSTTTEMTPDEIHDLGLKEVARILAEMEQVKTQVGFKGDLNAFFRYLQDDPKFYYTKADDLIAGYQDVKRRIDAVLPKYFSLFPKADYEVRAVEAFRAESAAGGSYQQPSADGSRPGIFYVNTFNLKAQPKFGMETLSLHEAAPGHHFQISIQQELTELPRFRRFGGNYTAYVEGWALYAESIGKEMGLFTDPYQYYGRLSDEMLRALRLVVDTGLHTRGWTREKAIQYMLDNSSMAKSDVEAEVERYIANPAQALGYKIGQIRIRQMRVKAEKALGGKFDIKQFHTEVLRDGALPMGVLEAKIDRWIAANK